MPGIKYLPKIAFLTLIFLCSSCFRDVDMDQIDEVAISPEAALDLIFFEITNDKFTGSPGSGGTASDETRLDFLDDDYIQNDLQRVHLNFRFTNSFESELTAVFKLRSPDDAVQHTIQIPIPAGNAVAPATVDFTEIINESEISRVRKSIKISVEITRQDPLAVNGSLELASKGFFYFEFN